MDPKLFLVTLVLVISAANCTPCSRLESLNITTGEVYPNGSVIHGGIEYPTSSWYEEEAGGVLTRFGCPCIGRVCLWKCCEDGQMFVGKRCNTTDVVAASPFNPPVYKGKELVNVVASQHFFYMYNELCEDKYLVDSMSSYEDIYIQENATLYEIAMNRHQWLSPTKYCVDMRLTNVSLPPRLVATVCYPEEQTEDDHPALYITYAVGIILSVPFLLATLLVYALIPELRNLHGMCLMAYCGGLVIGYPLLAYLKITYGYSKGACLVLAFIIYYAFQTSFFWMNVMCFDIWRTFSGYRGGSTSKRRERKRFALYGVYAWGVPLILAAITISMQLTDDLPPNIIRPGIGIFRCWFEGWINELVYFYTPVLILVICNVVLFSVTAHRIRSVRQETAILKGAESNRSDKLKRDKQRYALYLKLFVVMGVNWTVELISFVAGGSNWYWFLTDLSNIGLGFFIFFIFVWKNKVRNLIRKKFNKWRGEGRTTFSDSSTGRWATRSSTAPTETTRVSDDMAGVRLKDLH